MSDVLSQTQSLLQRWHGGERTALDELLDRDLEWIKGHVRARLGSLLSAKAELDDYVQDVVIKALEYGPKVVMTDRGQFRALMSRIAENTLRNHVESLQRRKRDARRESPVLGDSILYRDPPHAEVTRPSAAAQRNQDRAWIRLAVDLLEPEDSRLVRLREWDGWSFAEIGTELGIAEDAARMRFHRLLPKLARQVEKLQSGSVQQVLDETLGGR